MSRELIRIEPVDYAFRVELSVGTVCNYRCPYCIEKSNLGDKWIDMDALINFCNDVSIRHSDKPVTFALCNGGEPSMHPRIIDFMKAIKSRPNNIFQLTSNGSRPMKWWVENLHYLDHLVMSFHSTECDHEEFFEKVRYISQRLTMTVVIPLYSPIFDAQYEYGQRLVDTFDNVFVAFKPLVHKPYEPPYEWTEEQKQYFLDNPYFISPNYDRSKRKAVNIDARLIYNDGSFEEVRPQILVAKDEHHFRGWKCHIGTEFMKVDHDGNIFTCTPNSHGNISDGYDFPTEPVFCPVEKCNCAFMMNIKKEKPLEI